jgi:hypothetical protein
MDQISGRRLAKGFWGGKEMKWGGGRKAKGCGVIEKETKWIREARRTKKCVFDFDFRVL